MKKLRLYISNSTDVRYNLALEEHLLSNELEDILLFYRNTPSVVIGKHQNPWLEVNIPYCQSNGITVARRLSGGGTVYHDENNLNFSFIRTKPTDFVNFREHIEPISSALNALGIRQHITERNDLFIGDHKISGNAEHVNNSKKRILHHGTLLFSSNLDQLRYALNSQVSGIETHAVDSVRSPVTTIASHSDFESMDEFVAALLKELPAQLELSEQQSIDPTDLAEVDDLVHEKYSQWQWIMGHTPQFTYSPPSGHRLTVRKGVIIDLKFYNATYSAEGFINKPFNKTALKNLLLSEMHPIVDQICID